MMSRFWCNQRGDGELAGVALLAVMGLALYGGYQVFLTVSADKNQLITADGETAIACTVSVSKESGGGWLGGTDTFDVRFLDASGLAHELRGVRKVTLTELPKMIDAPMPSNPSLIDGNGKPYLNGTVYRWTDGSQAKWQDGRWQAVQVPNDACPVKSARGPTS